MANINDWLSGKSSLDDVVKKKMAKTAGKKPAKPATGLRAKPKSTGSIAADMAKAHRMRLRKKFTGN